MSSRRDAGASRSRLPAVLGILIVCGTLAAVALDAAESLARRLGLMDEAPLSAEAFHAADWIDPDRVNILLMGIDERANEQGPWRTDTLMLISIDPVARSAGMLSIPRDLWVTIPGYAVEGKINTAHFIGDAQGYPGGGPALATATVEQTFGLSVPYYARLNFTAFERLIDLIGGIDVNVPQAIDDPLYPDSGYGFEPLHVDAGWQHMDGRLALKYARTRHSLMGDFDRIQRQHQVILAVRDEIVNGDQLLSLMGQIGPLLETLGDSIRTNLTPGQIAQLARLGAQIDPARLGFVGIAPSQLTLFRPVTFPPQEALLPVGDALQETRHRLLAVGVGPAETAASATPVVYVVRPGDTLFAIAQRFGVDAQALAAANALDGFEIQAGQQLVIPAP